MSKQYKGMWVYVKSTDGAKTRARLISVLEESVEIKYPRIGGTFTFSRDAVVDEKGERLKYNG